MGHAKSESMVSVFESEVAARLQMLEGIGYMSAHQGLARSLTAPWWWYAGAGRQHILHNGTVCFVNTGKVTVAVSALHVYRSYLKDKHEQANFGCQWGSATIEPEKYLLDENEGLDLVTFSVPEVLRVATRAEVHSPRHWPPEEVKPNEVVTSGGYPGWLREEKLDTAELPFVTLTNRVLSVTPENVTLQVDVATIRWGSTVRPHERGLVDFGGISGGPIYRIKETPIETLELVGFIYESSIKSPTAEEPRPIGFVFGSHAWRVNVDGRIVT